MADSDSDGGGVASDSETDEEGLRIGDVVTYTKRLTESDVRAFARASGDENPLHLSESYASESRFGTRIAHGILVAGVISAALAKLPGLVVYLSQDLRFLAPVELGDRVTAECEVLEPLGDDRYRLHTAVRTGDGTTAIDGEAVVLLDEQPAIEDGSGANTYQIRDRSYATTAAVRALSAAAEAIMSSTNRERTGDPIATLDRQRDALDLTRRGTELQVDLPRRFWRALLAETGRGRSTQQHSADVARTMTRLAMRTWMTPWSSSPRVSETEVEIEELLERSFDPLSDVWMANWELVESALEQQIAAYEGMTAAATDATDRSVSMLWPWSLARSGGDPG